MPNVCRLLALLLLCATAAGAAPVEIREGVVLMPNDETISPFNRPFNLTGKSVTFTRTSPSTFASRTGPLQFEEERGTQVTLDRTSKSATYDIVNFDFPFFGTTVRKLYLSQLLAIYLDVPSPPPPLSVYQWGEAEVLSERKRVIAPLLTTTRGQGTYLPPNVYVRELADRLIVTWYEETRGLAIQAVLFASGDIRFSYRDIANTRGGALVIASGDDLAGPVEVVATDPANDVRTSAGATVDAMLDVTSVAVHRLGSTNLLEASVTTREPIDLAKLTTGFISLDIAFGPSVIDLLIQRSGALTTSMPHWRLRAPAPSVRIEGNVVKVAFAQERLFRGGGFDGTVHVTMTSTNGGDDLSFAARFAPPPRPASTDFAALPAIASLSAPILDAFVLPEFNYVNAGIRAQELLRYDPEEIDAVIFYQTYATSTSYEGAATASIGNAGVDRISFAQWISSTKPREPNLVFMNTLNHSFNANDVFATQVLMHEFTHRWLFWVHADVPLTPEGGLHPLPQLDTSAAFPVRSAEDCSVIGGAKYVERPNGTFVFGGPDEGCGNGLSWLDLYLMGLAAPEEVPPFFYISDYPEGIFESIANVPFRARRNEVTIDRVIARMGGPRFPAYPDTQRTFRAIFVLVHDPAIPVTEDEVGDVARFARLLRESFSAATGGRGNVVTDYTPPPLPKKRRSS